MIHGCNWHNIFEINMDSRCKKHLSVPTPGRNGSGIDSMTSSNTITTVKRHGTPQLYVVYQKNCLDSLNCLNLLINLLTFPTFSLWFHKLVLNYSWKKLTGNSATSQSWSQTTTRMPIKVWNKSNIQRNHKVMVEQTWYRSIGHQIKMCTQVPV